MDLGNLASALLGALLGVAGAFAIQAWQDRRAATAAARAVHIELSAAAGPIQFMQEKGVRAGMSVSAWPAERSTLAHYLTPSEYLRVARAYAAIENMNRSGYRDSGSAQPALQADAGILHRVVDEALAAIEPKAWTGAARDELHKAVKRQ